LQAWGGKAALPHAYSAQDSTQSFGANFVNEPTPQADAPEITVPQITLYTSAVCGYCMAAKSFLKSRGLQWTEVRIDTDPAQREKMVALARRTSVPQIFVGDTHVGGYDDMIALHRAGGFEPLLAGKEA
jgi:glutaredoxin 3